MCVGIPAKVIEFVDLADHLVLVDVNGAKRRVDASLVLPDGLKIGDWVLVHVGFAMAIIDEDEARKTLEFIMLLGSVYDDEIEHFGSAVT